MQTLNSSQKLIGNVLLVSSLFVLTPVFLVVKFFSLCLEFLKTEPQTWVSQQFQTSSQEN